MKINNRSIGTGHPPYIIAELSGNHNQSLERALNLVEVAADCGVDAIKLQTYTAETMTIDSTKDEFTISDPNSIWKGQTGFELYSKAYTPWEWHKQIFELAKSLDLTCFSSPFDESAVDFLETLDTPAYKIASHECIDLPLIRKVAKLNKPMIVSTGMATLSEIHDAVEAITDNGNTQITLLKCTSTYPASPDDCNLKTIPHMRGLFGCEVGLSDHTLGIGAALAAIAMDATVIEKHITLSRQDGGVDSSFSLEASEFKSLVNEAAVAWSAKGQIKYGPTDVEVSKRERRRSLYIAEDLKAGDILTPNALRKIRPGYGLNPKYYTILLGKKVNQEITAGTPMSWDFIG